MPGLPGTEAAEAAMAGSPLHWRARLWDHIIRVSPPPLPAPILQSSAVHGVHRPTVFAQGFQFVKSVLLGSSTFIAYSTRHLIHQKE